MVAGESLAACDAVLVVAPRTCGSVTGVLAMRPSLGRADVARWLVVRGPAPGGLGVDRAGRRRRPAGPRHAPDGPRGWSPRLERGGVPTPGARPAPRRASPGPAADPAVSTRGVADRPSSTRSVPARRRTGAMPTPRVSPSRRRRGRRCRARLQRAARRRPGPCRDELFGAGPLQVLLDDPDVTDVLVNGPRDVWVERAGRPVSVGVRPRRRRRRPGARGPARGRRRAAARRRLAGGRRPAAGRHPSARGAAAGGGRLRADQPAGGPVPRVHRGRSSSRRGRSRRRSCRWSARSSPTRANLLVSGATGSGKTTLLAALLSLVPHDERIVVVEEAGELRPRIRTSSGSLARHANVDGAGRGGPDRPGPARAADAARPDRRSASAAAPRCARCSPH